MNWNETISKGVQSMKFSILKRVMSYCKPYNRFFIAAIVSAVIQISLTLYGPILVGQAVDYMIGYRNVDHIAILQTICIFSATIVVSMDYGILHS